MSDSTPAPTPNLLVPDHRVMSLDDARAEQERKRRPIGKDGDWMTRGDFNAAILRAQTFLTGEQQKAIGQGLIALGQKLYDQWGEETQRNLQQMEEDVYAAVVQKFENERRARSWRGRWDRLTARFRRSTPPTLTLETDESETGPEHWQDNAARDAAQRALQEQVARDAEEASRG
jgi:hypothetical protein